MNVGVDMQALNELIYKARCPQTDSPGFREVIEKIGEILALQVLDQLDTEEVSIETLMGGTAVHHLVKNMPVLVTILRAGLPLNAGVQKVFPYADVGFLAMSRNEDSLEADVQYIGLPNVNGKTVIITDTMLATGGSLLQAINIIQKRAPKKILIINAIAAQSGIDRIHSHYPHIKIFSAAIDPTLNDKGYIVPGLGDAGDRSYGNKVSFG